VYGTLSITTFTTTIRAISPSVTQARVTDNTQISIGRYPLAVPDNIQNQAGHNVGKNQHPANRRNTQKIINNTMAMKERPQIAGDNGPYGCQAEHDKPGTFIFSE
jgi:hypothetical protein